MTKKLIYVEDAIEEIIKKLGIRDESYLTAQEKAVVQVLRDMAPAQSTEDVRAIDAWNKYIQPQPVQDRPSDLISKQAVIKLLDDGIDLIQRALDNMELVGVYRDKFSDEIDLLKALIDSVEELPSAAQLQWTPQWVLVSKTLPKKDQLIFVTDSFDNVYLTHSIEDNHCECYDNFGDRIKGIIAWAEFNFPEPYKEE